MDYIISSQTFLLNERNKEIVPSEKMSKYSPGELREYFDIEIVIATLQNEKGDIYTTFEIDNYNIEGTELKLPLYCKDKVSYIESYMETFSLVNGWEEDTVMELCIKQSDSILLNRALEVVKEYPENIIELNETEYFKYKELHQALIESNALYEKCIDYYMEDYSMFQIEKSSPYIKDRKSFYKELTEKSINIGYHEGKNTCLYSGDLKYILFTHLNYQKVLEDINYHQKTVMIGNIELILVNIEIMLNAFINNINHRKNSIAQKDKKVLQELNYILDDILSLEEE